MDEYARTLEHHETTKPHHDENYCEDKKHGATLLSLFQFWHRAGGRDNCF